MKAAKLICGLIIVGLLISMTAAGALAAAGSSATPTPVATPHSTVTPTPLPTPVPTPAPRTVFSAVSWSEDHAVVTVTNNGAAIKVEACIGSESNKTTTEVPAGATTHVPTMSIVVTPGQSVRCWFYAYENGTLIDSMVNVPVTVTAGTPTPPPEAGILTGTVVDATSGSPINGAEVIFTSETYDKQYPAVYTDASGTFLSDRMYLDSYVITVKANGYQTMTGMRVDKIASGIQKLTDPVKLTLIASSSTPTPTPTPSVTPGPLDAWMNLLYSPQACCGTLAVALGAIVSATAIYEWTMRQRERRKKEAAEGKKESKDSK